MQILDIKQADCEHNKINYDEIKVDPSFRKINKHSVGFHIWKVDSTSIEAVPKSQYGTFYDENTYIIYAAAVKGTFPDKRAISRDIKTSTSRIERSIHIWLGENTTSDRSKAAAYKIIELDAHTDHTATLFRESQDNESCRFLSYFNGDEITILCGTNSISTPAFPRLYQIRGKTCSVCTQRKTISWQHFTSSCVMVLATKRILFVWIGRACNSIEKQRGLKIATKLKDQYVVPELTIVDDGYEQSMIERRKTEWNRFLNLGQRMVQPVFVAGPYQPPILKLYQCDTVSGIFRVELAKTGCLEQIDLYGKYPIYIIDAHLRGVWIWVGRKASKQERADAMRHARGYVIKKNYPSTLPVIRVIDRYEPAEFVNIFASWIYMDFNANSKKTLLEKFDALTLICRPKLAAQTQLIDDGSGEIKLYIIEYEDIKEIKKRGGTALYSGNCYIVHYTIGALDSNLSGSTSGIRHVMYLWCGRNCTNDDRESGEVYLAEMSEHLRNSVVQVKLTEGLESPHFLQIFKGRLIILNGRCTSHDAVSLTRRLPSVFMLKVVGNSTFTSKAIQVSNKTPYTPEDCYVLKSSETEVWIWCGQKSCGDTREMTKAIGTSLIGECTLVMEGNEPDEFLSAIGEKFAKQLKKAPSLNMTQCLETWDQTRIGFYICTVEQGKVVLSQIMGFDQQDLQPEHVYLLDIGSMVYVWIGAYATVEDRKNAWCAANTLLTLYTFSRDVNTPVAVIKQYQEPITFIGFFENWNYKFWEYHTSYERLRHQTEAPGVPIPLARTILPQIENGSDFDRYSKYPIDMLTGDASLLPSSVDPTRKEVHLTHDDFVAIFKMTFAEFDGLPKWKQVELKKQYKLF
uniref:CSON014978 protein n=1 Tax=Culicoides sonorensis TaxID=179676 RepID=A0A336MGA1_CULSO